MVEPKFRLYYSIEFFEEEFNYFPNDFIDLSVCLGRIREPYKVSSEIHEYKLGVL